MLNPEEALSFVLAAAAPLPITHRPLDRCLGAMLAEPLSAVSPHPPFRRAMMDGFALRSADAGAELEIVGESAAGRPFSGSVGAGQAIAIMTGAACPDGVDTVVPVEQVTVDGERVRVPAWSADRHIAAVGSDCAKGAPVAPSGSPVTPMLIAAASAVGCSELPVREAPRVTVVATGTELVPPGQAPGFGQIHDANGPMLGAFVEQSGAGSCERERLGDDDASIGAVLDRLLDESRDVVVLTGGVSVGKYDRVPDLLAARGFDPIFRKVRQKPGKPLMFGRVGKTLVFGLPGNPLSSHFCFARYVLPALRIMMGHAEPVRRLTGRLTEEISSNGTRSWFVPAELCNADGTVRVHPLVGASSADIFRATRAQAYLEVPAEIGKLPAGAEVRCDCFTSIP